MTVVNECVQLGCDGFLFLLCAFASLRLCVDFWDANFLFKDRIVGATAR